MLKNLLKSIFEYKIPLNPFLWNSALNIEKNVNFIKREKQIVISLYANENSLDNLHITIYSILNQTVSPDKFILWLSDEFTLSELPYSITKYIKNGLDIRFVKDKGEYTNNIYALKEFGNYIIVTADADIIYPKNWLELMYHSYIAHPSDIQVHKAINVDTNNNLSPVVQWNKSVKQEDASFKHLPSSTGGILYPPKCFVSDVFREDIYNKKSNVNWVVWCWIMSIVSNRKIRVVKNHIKRFGCTNLYYRIKREYMDIKQLDTRNRNIQTAIEYYKQNINHKLKSE